MSLQPGSWLINGNGFEGQLKLTGPDSQGRIGGTVYDQQIFGFWDDTAQKITFMRINNPDDPSTFQIYTGYQFFTRKVEQGGGYWTLTGSFEAFTGTGATAQRSLYGWLATIALP